MKLKILSVGTNAPVWVRQGFETFASRMPAHLQVELAEIPASKHVRDPARFVAEEGDRILARVRSGDWVVALDEKGRSCGSVELAERLDGWQMQGADVIFAIGGSDGLADSVRQRADEMLSLSALTLPHYLVRVVLAETLYRAWTITAGHPYHRA